jgi:DNA repair protein RadC
MADYTDSQRWTRQLAQELIARLGRRRVEVFTVVFLDRQGRTTATQEMFKGTADRVTVDFAAVAKAAYRHGAYEVVVSHNHTHGSPQPSEVDCRFTQRLRLVLAVAGVPLRDHIIVSGNKYYSMSECGPWTAPLDEFAALTGLSTLDAQPKHLDPQPGCASRAHRIFQRHIHV